MKNKKDNNWHHVAIKYDGSPDLENIKLCYYKKIDGIHCRVCEQNGKIISKIPISEITW